MKYSLIVFDWDGTLYDSAQFIVNNVQEAFREVGLPTPESKVIRSMIGLSFMEALRRAQPGMSSFDLERLATVYRHNVSLARPEDSSLFPGVKETLLQLKESGYILAIATGKSRAGLNLDLENFKLKDLFFATRCGDETFSKPHPQMLLDILEKTGCEPSQALMVGDTSYDMELAQNAKVDGVAVSYGVHDEVILREVSSTKTILNDIRDLPIWLAKQ